MKAIFFIMAAAILGAVNAQAVDLNCDPSQKETVLATKVSAGDVVNVVSYEYSASSGYQWFSKENLKKEAVINSDIGSPNQISFAIDTNKQKTKTKKYTFNYRRSWVKTPVSVCLVTVVLK